MDTTHNTKICSRCKIQKPLTEFGRHKASKDGFMYRCRACGAEVMREVRQNPDYRAKEIEYAQREEVRERKRAHERRYYRRDDTRERRLEYARQYRQKPETQERQRQYIKAYRLEYVKTEHGRMALKSKQLNRRARIIANGGTLTASDIALVRKGQTNPKTGNVHCWHCNKPITGEEHVDHFIPISKGGRNDAGNIRISCAECNLKKGAKLPSEYNGRLI